jgi:hypothetical protein
VAERAGIGKVVHLILLQVLVGQVAVPQGCLIELALRLLRPQPRRKEIAAGMAPLHRELAVAVEAALVA